MKRTLLFFLLAGAVAPTAVYAQKGPGTGSSTDYAPGEGTESRNTGFGIKGGYNLASIQGSGASLFTNRDNLKDFHAGVYAQYGLNNFASLMVELLYSRKGYHTDYLGTTGRDTRLDYLELPMLFVANLTETLSLHVGPQVSVLTNVRDGGATVSIGNYGFNSFDYGGIAGAEARLGFAKVGARFDWSLGKIYKDGTVVHYTTATSPGPIGDSNIRNQVFQVYLGLGFKQ
ncbi:MAG: hypothetical protein NVS3B25_14930 [Hymenobacter sp.]